ncbi:hypothetical protein [Nocardia sp. NPDC005998]|uniref:hypothetical protein n=1 Tax=Nocardia sp. NPDC005998 TaxID=3156894 RepID=UPI0033B3FE29
MSVVQFGLVFMIVLPLAVIATIFCPSDDDERNINARSNFQDRPLAELSHMVDKAGATTIRLRSTDSRTWGRYGRSYLDAAIGSHAGECVVCIYAGTTPTR